MRPSSAVLELDSRQRCNTVLAMMMRCTSLLPPKIDHARLLR
jgi:hypothetical protein